MRMHVTVERSAINLVTVEIEAETGDQAEEKAVAALNGPQGFGHPDIIRVIEDNCVPDSESSFEGLDVSLPDGSQPPEKELDPHCEHWNKGNDYCARCGGWLG